MQCFTCLPVYLCTLYALPRQTPLTSPLSFSIIVIATASPVMQCPNPARTPERGSPISFVLLVHSTCLCEEVIDLQELLVFVIQ